MSGCENNESKIFEKDWEEICKRSTPIHMLTPDQLLSNRYELYETITIKKALWEEMLAYKEKIDNLEKCVYGTDLVSSIRAALDKSHIMLDDRIRKIEIHKNYQIDENRKEARLIDNIDERINSLEEQIKYNMSDSVKEFLDRLVLRLNEIERFQDITNEQYKMVIKEKKPYKCPICDGKRLSLQYDSNGGALSLCHPCEGKGIVWN